MLQPVNPTILIPKSPFPSFYDVFSPFVSTKSINTNMKKSSCEFGVGNSLPLLLFREILLPKACPGTLSKDCSCAILWRLLQAGDAA